MLKRQGAIVRNLHMDVNLTTTMGMIIAMHKASRMRHGSKAIRLFCNLVEKNSLDERILLVSVVL